MKHADLIRAALDGKSIEYRCLLDGFAFGQDPLGWGPWREYRDTRIAVSSLAADYQTHQHRIKPESIPDVIRYKFVPKNALTQSPKKIENVQADCLAAEGTLIKFVRKSTGEETVEIVNEA